MANALPRISQNDNRLRPGGGGTNALREKRRRDGWCGGEVEIKNVGRIVKRSESENQHRDGSMVFTKTEEEMQSLSQLKLERVHHEPKKKKIIGDVTETANGLAWWGTFLPCGLVAAASKQPMAGQEKKTLFRRFLGLSVAIHRVRRELQSLQSLS